MPVLERPLPVMLTASTRPSPPSLGRRPRWPLVSILLLLATLLLPLPWLHLVQEQPPGAAWRLDGRLVVDGERISPEGRWTWLTVGRPPLLGEVLLAGWRDDAGAIRDLRGAAPATSPTVNEPLAAAVGLQHAGHDIGFRLVVEVADPTVAGYPAQAQLRAINGVLLADQAALERALARRGEPLRFTTSDGRWYRAPGDRLPYERVYVTEVASRELDAAIAGRLSRLPPVRWFRSLALGRSHGLMVALTTYAHEADPDLAAGAHIAGTGGIRADGTVTPIGGLVAKATAARRAGADVLLYPAAQVGQLERAHFDPGTMELVPVDSLTAAIAHLEARRPLR